MFALTEAFGWTPEYIRSMDEYDKACYIQYMIGKNKAGEDNG